MLALCLVLRSTHYASIMPGAKEYPIVLALCLVLRSAYYASIMPDAKECLLC